MLKVGGYVFKRAETAEEFEQVHALNYRTFVNEIPQHADSGQGFLVDKFHHKNTYLIALRDGQLVGMVSVHSQPPFSIADRLPDPSILTRPSVKPMEVRLLAVEPGKRHSVVFAGLVWTVYQHAVECGITHLFISGVKEQLALYRNVGFEPLGPEVQGGRAIFVPMMVELKKLGEKHGRAMEMWRKHLARVGAWEENGQGENQSSPFRGLSPRRTEERPPARSVCLLPGPVSISQRVLAAFHRPPIYHRGAEFIELFQRTRGQLAEMTTGRCDPGLVALFNGSGTLANEVVAATLAANPRAGQGLMLVNGEFGQRLVRQAARFGLCFEEMTWPWGEAWDLEAVARRLDSASPRIDWVWGVHQESSTGVLNDLAGLVRVAQQRGVKVCADCISSLGATALDLTGVYLASGATGKALGSIAGLAVVFAPNGPGTVTRDRVPSYLDVTAALETVGPRFTFPSSTLFALEAALEEYATPEAASRRYVRYQQLGEYVRQRLRGLGIAPLAREPFAAPVLTTFHPPGEEPSESFVRRCESWGFTIGGASGYLRERRLVQIATMGELSPEDCAPLFDRLAQS